MLKLYPNIYETMLNKHSNTRARSWLSHACKEMIQPSEEAQGSATSSIRRASWENVCVQYGYKTQWEDADEWTYRQTLQAIWRKHMYCRKAAWSNDHTTFKTGKVQVKATLRALRAFKQQTAATSLNNWGCESLHKWLRELVLEKGLLERVTVDVFDVNALTRYESRLASKERNKQRKHEQHNENMHTYRKQGRGKHV